MDAGWTLTVVGLAITNVVRTLTVVGYTITNVLALKGPNKSAQGRAKRRQP